MVTSTLADDLAPFVVGIVGLGALGLLLGVGPALDYLASLFG